MPNTDKRRTTTFAFRPGWLDEMKRVSETAGYVSFTDFVVTACNQLAAAVRREQKTIPTGSDSPQGDGPAVKR
jgi:hypothetical protein